MATLVLDIETVGENWEELDELTQSLLTRWIDRTVKDDKEYQLKLKEIKEGLGFSPLTGKIISIGLYDLERAEGLVYYSGQETDDEVFEGYTYKSCSEIKMLERFWEGIAHYDTIVTFNGRVFDIPYISHRSAINRITPTVELTRGRYLHQQGIVRHIDLFDQLTWYGAMQRKPSLHLFCRAYGIESPKANGISGGQVAELFSEKKFSDLAQYNAGDVRATVELYKIWQQYFSFIEQEIDF